MHIEEFDYHLPQDAIAQHPAVPRDSCRLLVMDDRIRHQRFTDITGYLHEGDILVVNDTRVRHARIHARKDTGGKIELLVLGQENGAYRCMVKGRVREGTIVELPDGETATVIRKNGGICHLDIPHGMEQLEALGEMPLPPYIKADLDAETKKRYQSVYADEKGSVAAPTAGLHFTPELLDRIRHKGVTIAAVTLHVGIGTFMPIRGEHVEEHSMHREWYSIDDRAAEAINRASDDVIAVGTTTIRALESATTDGEVQSGERSTDLYIYPGYRWQSPVTGMLTNFHLPQSTPLLMVCAYAGRERIMRAYREALRQGYRFLSFGDAMYIRGAPCSR
jgi:S-adenosylmethionine:tRNA ribosyltransferase-isomerase